MAHIQLINVMKTYQVQLMDFIFDIGNAALGRKTTLNRPATTVKAVDDVSLTIKTGERIGIVGPNGAGKSTLLHMIAGLTEPSTGEVLIEGHVTSVMTLGTGLREELTGRENIYIDGELQGKSRKEINEIINDVIEFADLREFIDYPVRTYSTGMKSRLGFAMISYIDPDILLIDEVLAVGDAIFAAKATRRIREICGKGKIVIVVSHALQSVIDICNRCLWMENGKIVMDGDPTIVTRAYTDSVRQRDEILLIEKFRRHIGAESFCGRCKVTRLETGLFGNVEAQAIVDSGADFSIRIDLEINADLAAPDLRLLVKRIDGLVLIDALASGSDQGLLTNLKGFASFEVAMKPLVFNYGLYGITAELLDGPQVVARRSCILEVIALHAPRGGRTALLYPHHICTSPVA